MKRNNTDPPFVWSLPYDEIFGNIKAEVLIGELSQTSKSTENSKNKDSVR